MAVKDETISTGYSALDLRQGGAMSATEPDDGRSPAAGGAPPLPGGARHGERLGRAGGGPDGARTERRGKGRKPAGTAASRGGLTPRRSPCGDGPDVLSGGGALACQRDGRAVQRRAPVGPASCNRIRAQSIDAPQHQTPPRASAAGGVQGAPGAGAGPDDGRPAAGRDTDAVVCRGETPLLDNRHRIPSLKVDFNDLMTPRTAGQVYHNGRILMTPAGEVIEQVVASRPIFKEGGWEEIAPSAKNVEKGRRSGGGASDLRGAARARKELFRTAACNPDLSIFVTFTQSPELVGDRYDYKEAVKRLGTWLDNRVRRKGLKYIMVPELHQDGAIHWHGLVSENGVLLVDSGHRDRKGEIIYNVKDWHWGFTTATRVKDHGACCRYVSKYISKQMEGGTIGGRYWLHGGSLAKPIEQLFDAPVPEGGKRVEIEEAHLVLWYGGELSI